MSADLEQLRAALLEVETAARDLPWAQERPWLVDTHLWEEGGVPTVDLHDLSVQKSLIAVRAIATVGPKLEAGALRLITGGGRHTGGVSRLRQGVRNALAEQGYPFHAEGAARFRWVFDTDRAAAASSTGWALWGVAALVALGVMATLANQCRAGG